MIEAIEGAPADVLAFRAIGTISADDYETVLRPAFEAAIARGAGVRFVFELGPEFEGYSPGGAWEDMKFGLGHISAFERCAVVSDHKHLADAVRAFGILMPGEVRVFPLADLAAALDWAGESPESA